MIKIGAASLLQVGESAVTNWGNYYKLGQPLLQNRVAITNWDKMYCKLGQVLQIRAIITNWGIIPGDPISKLLIISFTRKMPERFLHSSIFMLENT